MSEDEDGLGIVFDVTVGSEGREIDLFIISGGGESCVEDDVNRSGGSQ